MKELLPDSEHTKSGTLRSSHPFLSRSATQFFEDSSLILNTTQKRCQILDFPRLSFPPLRGSVAPILNSTLGEFLW
uniref:Uncharacterized protein n=1 Tax=Fagus sylvatica TaxID=28930 RepID=A0A2N9FIK7_FAGSY